MPRPTSDDVQLILRLYELRRDPELRRARAFMLSEFNPKSWEEIRPHYLTGDEVDRHFRMATSYWEMVAAFVNRGLLDEDLFFDTHGEDMVVWKKVEPIIDGGRKHIRPTWLWNLERMARRHLAWRERTYQSANTIIKAGSRLGARKPRPR
ncbi:MAG: hypothetical protein E6K71_05930 [Candidatus Eisenbacteria bacterium]|uniref:Uncharacterized protein n=1 Tax=Eiseniibacteriota bacterium TaxID=2212470 RepID=A0A538SCQ3_UNCEI|nr:MAG: hypothetical protein E6K71_05930 [Candidatus Eisenbacteria bacterium]